MDMMLLGETIQTAVAQGHFGFWMPAGGNDGVAGFEVFQTTSSSLFTVHLETKSSDQADSSATSIGNASVGSTTPGPYKFDVSNARDLVRYRLSSTGDGDASIHLQFAQPLWQPN